MTRSRGAVLVLLAMAAGGAMAQPGGSRAASPAAVPIPETLNEQSYAPELIAAGRTVFGAQCGFCHGVDATGGAGGTDLTRSELVAADLRGDRIGPVIRDGRPGTTMPAFPALAPDDVDAIVAFIHDRKTAAESVEGGRRAVEVEDLVTGDAQAGQRFFAGECSGCHSATGDLAGIASRVDGLRLLQQMLYPRPQAFGDAAVRSAPRASVMTAGGERVEGEVEYEDEFTLALIDDAGRYRSFSKRGIEFEIDNPLAGHIALLGRLSDANMHDLITYLHTLQ